MRKLKAIGLAVLTVVALSGNAALAQGPDPDGPAKYGMCRAYFSGNGGENGNRNEAPPFAALEAAAEEAYEGDENDPIEDKVRDYCDGTRPGNGQGNGRQDDSSAPNPID